MVICTYSMERDTHGRVRLPQACEGVRLDVKLC